MTQLTLDQKKLIDQMLNYLVFAEKEELLSEFDLDKTKLKEHYFTNRSQIASVTSDQYITQKVSPDYLKQLKKVCVFFLEDIKKYPPESDFHAITGYHKEDLEELEKKLEE